MPSLAPKRKSRCPAQRLYVGCEAVWAPAVQGTCHSLRPILNQAVFTDTFLSVLLSACSLVAAPSKSVGPRCEESSHCLQQTCMQVRWWRARTGWGQSAAAPFAFQIAGRFLVLRKGSRTESVSLVRYSVFSVAISSMVASNTATFICWFFVCRALEHTVPCPPPLRCLLGGVLVGVIVREARTWHKFLSPHLAPIPSSVLRSSSCRSSNRWPQHIARMGAATELSQSMRLVLVACMLLWSACEKTWYNGSRVWCCCLSFRNDWARGLSCCVWLFCPSTLHILQGFVAFSPRTVVRLY